MGVFLFVREWYRQVLERAMKTRRPTVNARIVRLDVHARDLAVVHGQGIALATVVAEDGRTIKGEVKFLGEGTRGVAEEAGRFARRVEGFAPCCHAVFSTGKRVGASAICFPSCMGMVGSLD